MGLIRQEKFITKRGKSIYFGLKSLRNAEQQMVSCPQVEGLASGRRHQSNQRR
jgi:hypothetical protein